MQGRFKETAHTETCSLHWYCNVLYHDNGTLPKSMVRCTQRSTPPPPHHHHRNTHVFIAFVWLVIVSINAVLFSWRGLDNGNTLTAGVASFQWLLEEDSIPYTAMICTVVFLNIDTCSKVMATYSITDYFIPKCLRDFRDPKTNQ